MNFAVHVGKALHGREGMLMVMVEWGVWGE